MFVNECMAPVKLDKAFHEREKEMKKERTRNVGV
jgi:hypothetical protein